MAPNRLNQRQLLAIDNYLTGMAKKQALIKAGYSVSTASKHQVDFFERPNLKAEIDRRPVHSPACRPSCQLFEEESNHADC